MSYESEPVEIVYVDEFDAFEAIEFDTGSLPSGSPLAVRFFLKSWGGSYAEMEAESRVSWPDSLTQQVVGIPGTGLFEMAADLRMSAQITFDLWGYRGAYDVWSAQLELEDEASFDPLLLPDGAPAKVEVSADGTGIDPWTIEVPLFAGLELQFVVEAFPRVTGGLQGVRIETEEGDQLRAGDTVKMTLPTEDPGLLAFSSTYVAWVTAKLDVVIRPEMQICAPIVGCFRVARFDIPIPLVNEGLERAFDRVDVEHPLPVLEAPVTTHDFGSVEVDTLANLQLPLTNAGRMDLEGTLAIEGGNGAFSVFPDYFQASASGTDGAVVTFAPTSAGVQTATLVLVSNDPARPDLRIPLAGTGFTEPESPRDEEDPRLSGEVGCGCQTAPDTGWTPAFVGVAALWSLRRRLGARKIHSVKHQGRRM
jgi:MYXO-CTERM domain-containing protein